MATRVIDDSKLQNIAVAIQGKDGGGKMTVEQMPARITEISTIPEKPDPNGALLLMDWEGTILQSYTHAEAMALEALPNVADTPYYPPVDHELLTFQGWTWSLSDIKDNLRNRPYGQLIVGAIYTPTDGQNHNYWRNSRITSVSSIYIQKRGIASIRERLFVSYRVLTNISIPFGVTAIDPLAFYQCYSLKAVNIPDGTTLIGRNSFGNCYSLAYVNIPKSVTSIEGFAFNSCSSLLFVNIPDDVSSILANTFIYCISLTKMNIPFNVSSIEDNAFNNCSNLHDVVIHGKPALSNTNTFGGAPSDQKIYVHRYDLSWFETATNWSTIYAQGKIVAAADHLEHLISIGIDVTDFENEVISE